MDKKKSIINIVISVISKIITMAIMIVSRKALLQYLGEEALGIYSLYTNLIGVLAVAELGIGVSITFSMYKPIVEGESDSISSLYYLYKKIYLVLSIIVFFLGLIITPFLSVFAKGSSGDIDIQLPFIIFLASTCISYFYAQKTSLINAFKDNYINLIIETIVKVLALIMQLLLLGVIKTMEVYTLAILVSTLVQWIVTNFVYNSKYKRYINGNRTLKPEIKKEVITNTKAMIYHKLGTLMVNTASGLIISSFLSVIILGIYSNYLIIMTGMISVLSLVFSSTTSIIGHSFVKNDKESFYKNFRFFHMINFILALVFFIGFLSVIQPLLTLFFPESELLSDQVVFIFTITYFVQFMRQVTLTFRDASGLFYYDRYKPLIEGIINVIISLVLVNILGLVGILIANLLTTIFICHTVEAHIIYKYGFGRQNTKFLLYNLILLIIFIMVGTVTVQLVTYFEGPLLSVILYSGILSLMLSFTTLLILSIFIKDFRLLFKSILNRINKIIKHDV